MLAEVVFHCNHRKAALIIKLPLPYQLGRRRASVPHDPRRNGFGVHESEQEIRGSSSGSLMYESPRVANVLLGLDSDVNKRCGNRQSANSRGNGCNI